MEGKKISFGFSKSKPKSSPLIQRQEVKEKENVQYITSFDKNEKKPEVASPPELIIPVKTNYTVAERILNKKRTQEESTSKDLTNSTHEANETAGTLKTQPSERTQEESTSKDLINSTHETTNTAGTSKTQSSVSSDSKVSLETLAIEELLSNSEKTVKETKSSIAIPMKTDAEQDEAASNKVDYDSVPVSQFGYAMLRGMGWAPGKGIGKKQKVVEVVDLTLRPRSLGLGAGFIPDSKKKKPEG